LHVDLDAFFCSVEEIYRPELKNTPFATGGSADGFGVVTSCSYAARQLGIRSAMPMKTALRIAPGLTVVQSNYQKYQKHSAEVMAILDNWSPLVEKLSIDEAFLDLSDLPNSSEILAKNLQAEILSKTSLPSSIGAASNKLVAKIATNIGKSNHSGATSPMAITIVPHGSERQFLAPLPIIEMWGIGPKTAEKLTSLGIHSIGEILSQPDKKMEEILGKHYHHLKFRLKGIDDRPVTNRTDIQSISNERTYFDFLDSFNAVNIELLKLASSVGERLRKKNLMGKTIRVKIRWAGFHTITRQTTIKKATNSDAVIHEEAIRLFRACWDNKQKIRLLGIGATNLEPASLQLRLFSNEDQKEDKLLKAIDSIHDKYGQDIIYKGYKKRNRN